VNIANEVHVSDDWVDRRIDQVMAEVAGSPKEISDRAAAELERIVRDQLQNRLKPEDIRIIAEELVALNRGNE
jgi:hypothetical protein